MSDKVYTVFSFRAMRPYDVTEFLKKANKHLPGITPTLIPNKVAEYARVHLNDIAWSNPKTFDSDVDVEIRTTHTLEEVRSYMKLCTDYTHALPMVQTLRQVPLINNSLVRDTSIE